MKHYIMRFYSYFDFKNTNVSELYEYYVLAYNGYIEEQYMLASIFGTPQDKNGKAIEPTFLEIWDKKELK